MALFANSCNGRLGLREASVGYICCVRASCFAGVSPNKLFDYMVAGLPVIFAVRAGNDPVTESCCGVTVDPGDPQAICTITQLAAVDRRCTAGDGRARSRVSLSSGTATVSSLRTTCVAVVGYTMYPRL